MSVWLNENESDTFMSLLVHHSTLRPCCANQTTCIVILSARRVDKLKEVGSRCQQQQQDDDDTSTTTTTLSILPYDAAQLDTVQQTVDSALSLTLHGNIDVLILNAGVYQLKPALQTTFDETQYLFKVNLESPIALATTLIKRNEWKERGNGHVVVVTSLVARGAQSLLSTYAASKAAVRNYFLTLSTEESSWLRVDIALPGATDTGLWDSLNNTSIASLQHAKMSPQRVAHLILTGACGPYWIFHETYITKPIGLVWIYLSIYFPMTFHWMIHIVGYLRVREWMMNGSDVLDIGTLIKNGVNVLMGR